MKRLNNKGITTIEVLICFVIVVTITISIYTAVAGFNERKTLEGYKEKIYSYKNLLTKEMQDDFIKKGLTSARYEKEYYYYANEDLNKLYSEQELKEENASREAESLPTLSPVATKTVYKVYCTLKDGSERVLEIEQLFAASSYHLGGSTLKDDEFMIRYGSPDDMIDWDLPEVGYSGYNPNLNTSAKDCDVDDPYRSGYCRKVQDLSINNVIISTTDNILSIYIGFYHPEFASRYAINVVSPINYSSSDDDTISNWNY